MGDIREMLHDDYIAGLHEDEEQGTDIFTFESLNSETDKAWNITIDGKNYWLPKSQCSVEKKEKEVYIPDWLISKNRIGRV